MSSRIKRWYLSSLASVLSSASSRRAICRRCTSSLVRMNSTRHPFSTSASPMAAAKWLLPPPGGPNSRRLAPFSSQLSPAVSAITCALLTMGTASKSKLASVLPMGSRASARVTLDAAATPIGNLVFGKRGQETSRRPTFLVRLLCERRPHQFDGGQTQVGEQELDTRGVDGIGGLHAIPPSITWSVIGARTAASSS